MSQPMIELRDITRTYYNGEVAVPVLRGINLSIHRGEFVAIMGASGSGKSTLMNILGCLDRPSTGEYRFDGRDVFSLDSDGLARLRRESFGFVFQSYNLLPGISASENVEMPASYASLKSRDRQARAAKLLQRLGLDERMGHKPGQLSGGQQQRVSVARALMNGGEIILADEPTGALDSHSGREVMALLKELSAEGYTVILITHDSNVAEHAHRQIEIADGEIVSDPGSAGSLSDASLQRQPLAHRPSLARELYQGARTAIRSMTGNLFRTALTLLGIVIGVASVITMLAIGDGARESVVDRISAMGSNLLLVRPGAPGQRRGGWNIATLVPEDVHAINTLPNITAAIPELTGSQTLRYDNADHQAEVNATSWQFPMARQWPVARGSFFSEADEGEYAPVAVLGKTASEALFGEADPVGRYILMNNVLFQVIGVMSERGASPMGQDQDDVVLVPYTTGSMRIFGQRHLRNVTIAVDDTSLMDEVQAQVHQLLLQRHGVEDFQIRNMASLIDTVSETQDTFTWLLGSVAAISLLVGGIGVMNIMLVSVTERTREIGIRMATGARARHILQQFLLEALAVSALGGVIGVGLGLGAAAVVAHFGTPVSYSLLPVLLAFGCAFGTGLLFGFLPARKAARLDPVAALATE
ncbi:MacB family efflux pump subunit [Marinobacter salarius]|uniref:MacB family efflux pump subunit n=1 Tax=Marinobacter TaxID=2742 RepID=UPI001D182DB9|nr:MacB family efflux pump subunit [Marinobacter salarius]MCC4284164.1 MacB family efflux pump subunit [Marinobacter salarius]MDP4534398.1 MacB family efflux pump subunit [Marinobacter salarius]